MDGEFGLAEAVRTMVPPPRQYSDGICGETFDHDDITTFEDADIRQWVCRHCGAEGWDEKN